MKWYHNIAQSLTETLEQIFNQNQQADKVINSLLKKQKKWGSRDRRFAAEVLYDIVRWKRYYEFLADTSIDTSEGKWQILGVWSILNDIDLPDWKEFETIDAQSIIHKTKNEIPDEIKLSIPDWLQQKLANQLGKIWKEEMQALNQEAEVVLRANLLKTTVKELQAELDKNQIEIYTKEDYPEALFLKTRRKVTHLPAYKNGLFEIQDASSQLVAPFSEVYLPTKMDYSKYKMLHRS